MLTETQVTLRVLSISDSVNKTDNLLNKLKENGYNARGIHVDNIEQLHTQLDEFNHWDLIVVDENLQAITIEQTINNISQRNLYIPIIFISRNKQQAPYQLLHTGPLKIIIDEQDIDYFADLAIKEINDANIRKNSLLMSLALNSIETHSRNFLSQQNYALIYTVNGIICEVDDSFITLCNIEDKNIIIHQPIETLIDKKDVDIFLDFIQSVESATEAISVLQVSLNINEISIPVTMIVQPTSLDGKFSLCFQIKKTTVKAKNNLKKTSSLITKPKNNSKIIDYKNFQQQFNLALQKALSENIHSMICCINLGSLYKLIKNSQQVDCETILNDITISIKETFPNNLLITNLQNGCFLLLIKNINKTDSVKIINNTIAKLDEQEIIIDNNETLKINAFAGMAIINADTDNTQDLISRVKHESVVAYINKMKQPNLYLHNDSSSENSADNKILYTIKESIKNKKINLHYQGILNTKENGFNIYDCFALINTDEGFMRDSDLVLKFSNHEVWSQLDKLKVVASISEIKAHLAKIKHVIFSIGANSLKNNDFLDWLDDFIMQKQIDSSYFVIEVHEYFATKYIEETKKTFSSLKSKGYNSCISHFGCSINYKKLITDLEPNFIRLDNTFIDDLDENKLKDIKDISNVIKNFNSKIIAPSINNMSIMQKILQSNICLLTGQYIQDESQNIQTDLYTSGR